MTRLSNTIYFRLFQFTILFSSKMEYMKIMKICFRLHFCSLFYHGPSNGDVNLVFKWSYVFGRLIHGLVFRRYSQIHWNIRSNGVCWNSWSCVCWDFFYLHNIRSIRCIGVAFHQNGSFYDASHCVVWLMLVVWFTTWWRIIPNYSEFQWWSWSIFIKILATLRSFAIVDIDSRTSLCISSYNHFEIHIWLWNGQLLIAWSINIDYNTQIICCVMGMRYNWTFCSAFAWNRSKEIVVRSDLFITFQNVPFTTSPNNIECTPKQIRELCIDRCSHATVGFNSHFFLSIFIWVGRCIAIWHMNITLWFVRFSALSLSRIKLQLLFKLRISGFEAGTIVKMTGDWKCSADAISLDKLPDKHWAEKELFEFHVERTTGSIEILFDAIQYWGFFSCQLLDTFIHFTFPFCGHFRWRALGFVRNVCSTG